MTCKPDDLVRDPLFQLNAVLWLTQPLPQGAEIRPLLHESGFGVWAIAPALAPPPDLQLRAKDRGVALQASTRPDVVIANSERGLFAVTECKASSFGEESSNAAQARSLLVVGGPRCSEVLAITPNDVSGTLVAFVLPEDQKTDFAPTLESLAGALSDAQLFPGTPCILGLLTSAVAISLAADAKGAHFFGLEQEPTQFLPIEENTCPRPLYFIPYDPDHGQSSVEAQYSKRMLFERLLASAVCVAGRAKPPCDLLLEADGMLNDAMFGMYGHWEHRDARTHMRRLWRDFMKALASEVDRAVPGTTTYEPQAGWHVTIDDHDGHKSLLDVLTRFSCERLVVGPAPEPELFDALEDP